MNKYRSRPVEVEYGYVIDFKCSKPIQKVALNEESLSTGRTIYKTKSEAKESMRKWNEVR